MRIGIDYRVLSTDAAHRGMGRYTQQQLVKTLESDPTNDYVLLCYPGCRSNLIDHRILSAPNIARVDVELPLLEKGILGVHDDDVLLFSAQFQDFLLKLDLDVVHATTPFIPPTISDFDVCPHVVTLYDLIPLVYPDSYLATGSDEYLRGLEFIRKADRVVAISQSARMDALSFLGIPVERTSVMYPWVESVFAPLSPDEIAVELRGLQAARELPNSFLLSVTGIHHSKNARFLLSAYDRLPDQTRLEFPLVLVLPSQYAYDVFRELHGSRKDVIYLHDVSDRQLCALYNASTALIHPSRYEGFGYPVAEAMSCGAPVITTTASSLPEVGGDAALLVDPDDVEGLTDAVELACASEEARAAMSRRGLEHAAMFSLARKDVTCATTYDDARREAMARADRRPRIAVWSSLPPLPCGVADYTADLLLSLADIADVEVFADGGYSPSLSITQRHTVHHHAAFERRHAQRPFDSSIFQMGGTFMQEFMHGPIQRHGGIVVLHDLLMAQGLHHIYRTRDRLEEFRETILAAEGASAVSSFGRAVRGARTDEQLIARLGEVFAEHPLLGWLVESGDRQIVHMEAAKHELEALYPEAQPMVVDMGVVDPWRGFTRGDVPRIRWKHGLPSASFLIGVFGSVIPVKRLESCIQALGTLRARDVDCMMVVVGEAFDPAYRAQLDGLIQRTDVADVVRMLGRVSRRTFDEMLIACDAVVNLRFPSMKGMSAILVRALAAGKPVLITDIPEWRDMPDDCCTKIPPGETEVELIADRLQQLATHPDIYGASSAAARAYYRERGTTRRMAERYVAAVRALDHTRGEASVGASAQQAV